MVVCIGVAMGIVVGGMLLCVVTVFSKRYVRREVTTETEIIIVSTTIRLTFNTDKC